MRPLRRRHRICVRGERRDDRLPLRFDHAVGRHRRQSSGAHPVALGSETGETQRVGTVGLDHPSVLKAGLALAARLTQMLLTHLPPPFYAIVSGVRDRQGHTSDFRLGSGRESLQFVTIHDLTPTEQPIPDRDSGRGEQIHVES